MSGSILLTHFRWARPASGLGLSLRVAALLALSACQSTSTSLPGTQLDTLQGRKIETLTQIKPQAKAVVVFENGARGTIDKWAQVMAGLSQENLSIFAYNRPGYANSEVSPSVRTGKVIVEELHQLLQAKNLTPPYILVGHSMGGLYMQLYAKTYPNEVQGIVLVDALYPGTIKPPQDFPLSTRVAKNLFLSATVQQEIEHIYETGEAIWALPSIDDKPMVRLFNVPKSAGAIGVDFGVTTKDPAVIEKVKKLYPNARKVVADSAHEMQTDKPDIVIQAIKDVTQATALR